MITISKYSKSLLIICLCFFYFSCNTSPTNQQTVSTNKIKEIPKTSKKDKNYALDYIKKKLYPGTFDKISDNDKRYDAVMVDLNDDGKKETLFSMINPDYCGSGGCTLFLLSDKGEFRGKVTVMDFPVGISKNKTNGWKDLYVKSGKQQVVLQFGEGEYTTNASMAKKASLEERKASVTKEVLTKFAR